MNNIDIKKAVDKYKIVFTNEKNNFQILLEQLNKSESATVRANLYGHITASGIVIKDNKILLIFHNKLQKYLQPGGHIENDESLWKAAQREVLEETGIQTILHPWHSVNSYIPINIDTHIIPFNEKKQEPQHFHHDFTFVFNVSNNQVVLQQEEVSDYKWLSIESKFNEKLLDNVGAKISALKL